MKNHTLNPIPHTLILAMSGVLAIFTLTACEEKATAAIDTAKEAIAKLKAAVAGDGNTFTDSRDGKVYKTVKIGSQTWMAENLNYAAEGSKCYNLSEYNCQKYGRLYEWETAKKACPSGWHLPSNEEWDKLMRYVDGTSGTESPYKSEIAGKLLKSKEGWNDYEGKSGNGLDVFGFSALPGGHLPVGYGGDVVSFLDVGSYGSWWSASEHNSYYAYNRSMYYGESVGYDNSNDKSSLQSVRCVKSEAVVAPVATPAPVAANSKSGGNTFTDSRDKKTYKIVTIGKQTWLAENLNYKPSTGKSWCYDNKESNCAKYGRLYDWNTAKAACPSGWHLPTEAEWSALVAAAGGKKVAGDKLKAKSGWEEITTNGTDDFGFTAMAGGSREIDGKFDNQGGGYWWSATEYKDDSSRANIFRIVYFDFEYYYEYIGDKNEGYSIRCIKN